MIPRPAARGLQGLHRHTPSGYADDPVRYTETLLPLNAITSRMAPEPEPEPEQWQDVAAASQAARKAQLAAQLNGTRPAEAIEGGRRAHLPAPLPLRAPRPVRAGRYVSTPADASATRAASTQEPSPGAKLFVGGITERFESQNALVALLSQYGRCDAAFPPRVRWRANNKSWAVVTMESGEAAEAVLAAGSELPSPLRVTRYNEDLARHSTGAMAAMRCLAGIEASQITEELTEALEKLRRHGQGDVVEERPVVST